MDIKYISFAKAGVFSHTDQSYISLAKELRPFYHLSPSLENFKTMITQRSKSPINREVLCEVLRKQYEYLSPCAKVEQQIKKLESSNTYTLVTAHQPNLFTGPLYYIYKIISTINLSEKLKKEYPDCEFVPLFYLGAEDHDFEEINHVKIFRKKLEWSNNETGAVGQMTTATLRPVIDELLEIMGDGTNEKWIREWILSSWEKHKTYGKFTLELTHRLFADKGLLVLDASVHSLKRLAIPLFKKEILEQSSQPLVQKTQGELQELGFKNQAFARPINLFYLRKGYRERIEKKGDLFCVLNQNIEWTQAEILAELETYPERFSPNVVMRPLYQELILPNLAYIGGGGELAYWLERKIQFAEFEVSYPILIRRDSVLFIDKRTQKKMQQIGLNTDSVWQDTDSLIRNLVQNISNENGNIEAQKTEILSCYNTIIAQLKTIDNTLAQSAKSEMAKVENGLKNLEQKIVRAEKKTHEIEVNKIRTIKEQLFPQGSLQERKDNFIPIYLQHGNAFLEALYQYLDPLDRKVKILLE